MVIGRIVRIAACAALIGSVTVAQSRALQGPGGGRGGFGRGFGGGFGQAGGSDQSDLLSLVSRKEVAEALKIDADEQKKIDDLRAQAGMQMQEKAQAIFQGLNLQSLQTATPEVRQKMFADIQAKMQPIVAALLKDVNGKLKAVLTPEQATRLSELDKQRRGALALADPDTAAEVKVSADHQAQIAVIAKQLQAAQQAATQKFIAEMSASGAGQNGPPVGFQAKIAGFQTKLADAKKAAEAKAVAVLSDDEKASWKTATGEPFKFAPDPTFGQRPAGPRPAQ